MPPSPRRPEGATLIETDLIVARRLARPVREFLHFEAGGGIILLAATVLALVLANSGAGEQFAALWETDVEFEFGNFSVAHDLREWIDDGLMAIFFFVVGLEIKRELVTGELRDPRKAAVPALAALGGMVVPATIYLAFNATGEGASGWGIPMATDIGFAIGVVTLLGRRVPSSLKVFLLTLAIVDDIGAILVIAVFYTSDLDLAALAGAVGVLAVIGILRYLRVWYIPVYVVLGVLAWYELDQSGVHATLAGVALGLMTPARPLRPGTTEVDVDQSIDAGSLSRTLFDAKESISVAERLQHALHPWSSYVILPIFALANAGIVIRGEDIADAATSPVVLGVVAGLVVGKIVGVTGATWIAVRSGLGRLPSGATWNHVVGIGSVAGIGFTVALFIAGLAFTDTSLIDQSKLGILFASVVAAVLGVLILHRAGAPGEGTDDGGPPQEEMAPAGAQSEGG